MKKVLIALLLAAILCPCISAHCESEDVTSFNTLLLTLLDHNAKEWMSSDSNRALFAACAILDYGVQENIPYGVFDLYNGTVYVGRSSFILTVGYNERNNNDSLVIAFDTRDNTEAAYAVMPMNKGALEISLESTCPDGVYKVDVVDLKEVMDSMMEAIQNNQ